MTITVEDSTGDPTVVERQEGHVEVTIKETGGCLYQQPAGVHLAGAAYTYSQAIALTTAITLAAEQIPTADRS